MDERFEINKQIKHQQMTIYLVRRDFKKNYYFFIVVYFGGFHLSADADYNNINAINFFFLLSLL